MENCITISNMEYDVHTIRKVIALNSQLGEIRIHDAGDNYLLVFKNCPDDIENAKAELMKLLVDFTHNIWSH